ncbi:MAG TPA: hypothetical protein VN032_05640 [Thermoanaerobaculia bacterium]|jgi:hypothetical protein|nr:hypothetical protein [Thermoanaerobaculia bacterium]
MRLVRSWLGLGLLLCLPAAAEVVDRVAATVNDAAIPESEVRRAMVVSALEPRPGEDREAFRGRVLDALIEERLEYEDAARFGPAAPNAFEIDKAMASLRERIRSTGKDPDAEFARSGMTVDEVRASIERQLVIAAYLRERFAPIAYADEEQARDEYEKRYVPEQKAAGLAPSPFDAVAEEMRRRYSERAFDEEVAKWLKELRQKARISIFRIPVAVPEDRVPVVLSTAPPAAKTPAP